MSTPIRFERLLNFMNKNNPAYNVQLAHLESVINRSKLQTPGEYRNSYRRIKALVGPNYNARVAKGRNAIMKSAATLIQKHWRGTSVRKPKRLVFLNPNGNSAFLGTSSLPSILKKLRTAKVRRNRAARFN
jgi:hypothetical protein